MSCPSLFRTSERNALALTIDLMTNSNYDMAEMLARLMLRGDRSNSISELGNSPGLWTGIPTIYRTASILDVLASALSA